jgi:hypothetical protein
MGITSPRFAYRSACSAMVFRFWTSASMVAGSFANPPLVLCWVGACHMAGISSCQMWIIRASVILDSGGWSLEIAQRKTRRREHLVAGSESLRPFLVLSAPWLLALSLSSSLIFDSLRRVSSVGS